MRNLAAALFLLALSSCASASHALTPDDARAAWLRAHPLTPEEYVVSKFRDHDVVFVGEFHRIRHDVLLIQQLVPRLYAAGVYTLGIEFGDRADQTRVDALVNAPVYDEALARDILFRFDVSWGYEEYEDLYRAAWAVNHQLPPGARRFRVVNLNYRPDWTQWKLGSDDRRGVFFNGDADTFMAQTVFEEVLARREKALIYCGHHHAFTRFRQPVVNQGKLSLSDSRLGNLVYARIGKRAFMIWLDCPVDAGDKPLKFVWFADGAIARAAAAAGLDRIGFDVLGTPFGSLTEPRAMYNAGHPDFRLDALCDGYIYMRDDAYDTVTADVRFVTNENLAYAAARFPNPTLRAKIDSPEAVTRWARNDADVPKFAKRIADSARQ